MNLFIKQKQTYRYRKQTMVTKRETWQGEINQELRMNIHTRIDNQQRPTV